MNRYAIVVGGVAAVIAVAMIAQASLTPSHAARPRLTEIKDQAPTERTYEVAGGLLTVIDVPIAGLKMATERQTCYLWRDMQSTNAIGFQCPNDQRSYTLDPPD